MIDVGAKGVDTIVAPCTAPGRAALATVRLSGPETETILSRLFRPERLAAWRPRHATLGEVFGPEGEALDRGIAVFYRGPGSYTGEDMAEVTVHGSPPVIRAVIEAARSAGARLAEPGEFTRRALESGKLDLSQAEAVQDLVEASTLEQARIASRQLRGEVSAAIAPVAEAMVELLADVEADLDFAEDEQLGRPGAELARRCRRLAEDLRGLVEASAPAARVKTGARVVLLGPPNAGKSSLFNSLLRADRAIVTSEPGTTRDLVEEVTQIAGLPVVLLDGAGLAAPQGLADEEAMRRARSAAETADLVLEVRSLVDEGATGGTPREGSLPVFTHLDRAPDEAPGVEGVRVSNVTGAGLEELRAEIARRLEAPGPHGCDTVALASERHRERAGAAIEAVRRAADLAEAGQPLELCAVELRGAVGSLHEILGRVGPEELLGRIFSRFCIGK